MRLIYVGDFCVMLALEILICAGQTAVSRASQALNSPHINHPQSGGLHKTHLLGMLGNPVTLVIPVTLGF